MAAENTVFTAPAAPRRRSLGRYLIILVALAFIGLLAYGLAAGGDERIEAGKAPDFALTTFDGQTLRLSDLQGQPVVLNFWATWCKECENEASDLELAWRDYRGRGVQFIGIDYLDQEPLNFDYIKRYDITYPNGLDLQGRIYAAYGVQGLPETFVINQDGEVVKVYVGAVTRAALSRELDKLLQSS